MAAPWRKAFPGTWATSEAAISSRVPGSLVKEAMLGASSSSASLALSATDGADIAASNAALLVRASVAATDGSDAASAGMTVSTPASMALAGVEGPDMASGVASLAMTFGASGTEGADISSSSVALLSVSSLAGVEGSDVASASLSLAAGACSMAIEASEGADDASAAFGFEPASSGAGGLTPWSREQWEAWQRELRGEAKAEKAEEPEAASVAGPDATQKEATNIAPLVTAAGPAIQAPGFVIVADENLNATGQDMAAIAVLVLTARANAYRRANAVSRLNRAA